MSAPGICLTCRDERPAACRMDAICPAFAANSNLASPPAGLQPRLPRPSPRFSPWVHPHATSTLLHTPPRRPGYRPRAICGLSWRPMSGRLEVLLLPHEKSSIGLPPLRLYRHRICCEWTPSPAVLPGLCFAGWCGELADRRQELVYDAPCW